MSTIADLRDIFNTEKYQGKMHPGEQNLRRAALLLDNLTERGIVERFWSDLRAASEERRSEVLTNLLGGEYAPPGDRD